MVKTQEAENQIVIDFEVYNKKPNDSDLLSRQHHKQRWFKKGQKWRTGCESRISLLKRRHGLTRSRYKGHAGMTRWVGLGAIADNLINIRTAMTNQTNSYPPEIIKTPAEKSAGSSAFTVTADSKLPLLA